MNLAPQTILACAYGPALLLVAYLIDALARRASQQIERNARGAFRYHEDHDAWRCPQDQWLWPTSFDPDHRIMRYRASPTVCNSCPVKSTCTTSHSGREVVRAVDSWPASEAARFHRGIACAVATLGILWPLTTALTDRSAIEVGILLAVAAGIAVGSLPLWSHLRRSPAGYPDQPVAVRSLDDNLATRAAAESAARRRRTRYTSDGRTPAGEDGP